MKTREATESEKRAKRKSKRARVEERKRLELKDCRINSGKGVYRRLMGIMG